MRANRRHFVGAIIGAPAALALASPAIASRQQSTAEVHGINPADMDFSADPREDFYRFANGGWLDRVTIPGDDASYGVFTELTDRTRLQLFGLLEQVTESGDLQGDSDEAKAVRYFEQGLDLATRNEQGVAPIQATLDEIDAITDLESLHAFFRVAEERGVPLLLGLGVLPDFQDSTVNVVGMGGPYYGLPNRDYYLEESETNTVAREAYIATSAALLGFAGYDQARAEASAGYVYEFEKALVAPTLTREDQQDFSLLYNPLTVAEVAEIYPMMDWAAYMDDLGIGGADRIIVTELRYLQDLGRVIQDTSLSVVKDYLTLATLWNFSTVLSEEIETTAFAFRQATSGVADQAPLDERVLSEVNGGMPDAIGKLYVTAYFPPEAKARITELTDEVIRAFGDRIEQVPWMTDETRASAQEKLGRLRVKVGYPDVWKTYEAVEVGDSYTQTSLSAYTAAVQDNYEQYGEPVDKEEWFAPAQTVNAFYNSINNDITFPAGILQPPFFDYEADPASNFGAIGFVIGHEITHGFDQGGSQFDGDGNLANWWTEEDAAAFAALNQRVVDQFSAIEVLPGVFVDGQITIGENVADLGGVQVAHDALERYLTDNGSSLDDTLDGPIATLQATPAPVASPIAGLASPVATPVASPAVASPVASPVAVAEVQTLTQGERFYIAAATVWRAKVRDEALATQVQTGVHSPASVRATQPLRNMDEYHEQFGIESGNAMFLDPDERVVIW